MDADCPLCQSKLGAALLAANEPGLAEAHLRRATHLAPERGGLHIDLGIALALVGRDAEAEQRFRCRRCRRSPAGRRLSPDDPRLLVSLGRVLIDQGSYREAAVVLERAVAVAPTERDLRVSLARAYLAATEASQAAPHIAAIERLDPTPATALKREFHHPTNRYGPPK